MLFLAGTYRRRGSIFLIALEHFLLVDLQFSKNGKKIGVPVRNYKQWSIPYAPSRSINQDQLTGRE